MDTRLPVVRLTLEFGITLLGYKCKCQLSCRIMTIRKNCCQYLMFAENKRRYFIVIIQNCAIYVQHFEVRSV